MRSLVLSLGLLGLVALPTAVRAADPPADDEIGVWVRQLNSSAFLERERATNHLIEAGPAAIDAVTEAALGSDPEVAVRSIYVLQRLALEEEPAGPELAMNALDRVRQSEFDLAANRANEVLAELAYSRQAAAEVALAELGAELTHSSMQLNNFQVVQIVSTIRIGDEWRGTPRDLRNLRWMIDTGTLELDHESIDDSAMDYVSQMRQLQWLKMRQVEVTAEGLAKLEDLPQLSVLHIYYASLDDAALAELAKFTHLQQLELYGTGIAPEQAASLQNSLAQTFLDVRAGAFLGVSCGSLINGEGCQIVSVSPGEAAEAAGLRPNDIVTSIDGKKVNDFADLTRFIGEHRPGEPATIECLRGGETLSLAVQLGEWELKADYSIRPVPVAPAPQTPQPAPDPPE